MIPPFFYLFSASTRSASMSISRFDLVVWESLLKGILTFSSSKSLGSWFCKSHCFRVYSFSFSIIRAVRFDRLSHCFRANFSSIPTATVSESLLQSTLIYLSVRLKHRAFRPTPASVLPFASSSSSSFFFCTLSCVVVVVCSSRPTSSQEILGRKSWREQKAWQSNLVAWF